ncbi:MAG: hypothetical protein ACXAE3_15545 [Candidatus Kariarchaeaceae archaeon]
MFTEIIDKLNSDGKYQNNPNRILVNCQEIFVREFMRKSWEYDTHNEISELNQFIEESRDAFHQLAKILDHVKEIENLDLARLEDFETKFITFVTEISTAIRTMEDRKTGLKNQTIFDRNLKMARYTFVTTICAVGLSLLSISLVLF